MALEFPRLPLMFVHDAALIERRAARRDRPAFDGDATPYDESFRHTIAWYREQAHS